MSKHIVAASAGYCFGVERSMRMAREALEQGECWCLGELIHNRDAVAALEEKGLHVVNQPQDLPEGERIVIRSHGVNSATYSQLAQRKAQIIDATCPRVLRIHRIVEKASAAGRKVMVIGDQNHPEVQGICGWCEDPVVLPNVEAVEEWLSRTVDGYNIPLTVVFQTTQTEKNHVQIVNFLKKKMYKCRNI